MATRAHADTVVLRLEQTVDAAADKALGALGRLENQIMREQNALGRLEQSLTDAKLKLDVLAAGSPNKGVLAALEKQMAKVDELRQLERAGLATVQQVFDARLKLAQLQQQANAKTVDVAAYKKQENLIASLTDRIGAQKDKLGALSEKLKDSGKSASQMSDAAKYLGERFGITESASGKLLSQLKTFGPYAGIVVAGILAVVAAIGLYVGAVVKGLSASSQMRAEFLKLQAASVSSAYGFSWLWNATRESSRGAEEMQRAIDKVSGSSAQGRDKLAEYAAQIRQARFYGRDFETVLKAMSTASSGGTEQMAQDVLNWARQIRFMGGQVDDLGRRVEQKLGRTATEQASSFGVQLSKLSENIRWIFGGSDIDPLLRALRSVLKYFDAGSDTATGMRNAITHMVESAIGMLLRMGIVILKVYIWLREHELVWKSLGYGLKGLVYSALIAVGVAFGIILATLAVIPATIALAIKAWDALGESLTNALHSALDAVEGWTEVGKNIVMGIAEGIASGAHWVWDAIKNLAKGALQRFKDALVSRSPSVLFTNDARIAIPGGVSRGIDQGIPMVEHSSARLAVASRESFGYAMRAENDLFPPSVAAQPPANDAYGDVRISKPEKRDDESGSRPPSDGFGGSGPSAPPIQINFENCNFGGGLTQEDVDAMMQVAAEKYFLGRAASG